MKIQEIQELIEKDSVIDYSALDRESISIPYLHSKWFIMFSEELRTFHSIESKMKEMRKEKFLYYTGRASDEVYQETPLDHRVIKGDLDIFMEADHDMVKLSEHLNIQKIKIRMIEEFLKQISQRSFNIKNAIEFIKFKNGIS